MRSYRSGRLTSIVFHDGVERAVRVSLKIPSAHSIHHVEVVRCGESGS